jgi:hypothetical protein
LINRKIFSEQYWSLSSSLYSFLHSFLISSLFGPNIHLSSLFSNILSLRFSLMWGTKFQTHTKPQTKLYFPYLKLCVLNSTLQDKRVCTEWYCYENWNWLKVVLSMICQIPYVSRSVHRHHGTESFWRIKEKLA